MKKKNKILISGLVLLLGGATVASASTYVYFKINSKSDKNETTDSSKPEPSNPIVPEPQPEPEQHPQPGPGPEPQPEPLPQPGPGPLPQPGPDPEPAPGPQPEDNSTITNVSIKDVNEYGNNYFEGEEITLEAEITSEPGVNQSLITYQWYKSLNGKDIMITENGNQKQLVMIAMPEDTGMNLYVKATYKTTTLTSDKFLINVEPDDQSNPGPSPEKPDQGNKPPVLNPSDFDTVDKAPAPSITIPSGYTSWKDRLPSITPTPISSNQIGDSTNKLTLEDLEKEMVYQARFVLYQSYENNLSEVTYYSRKINNSSYECVAEGIIKNNVENKEAPIQFGGKTPRNQYSAITGDKIKVTFIVDIAHGWEKAWPVGNWSFTNQVDKMSTTQTSQYLTKFPSTDYKVEINGTTKVSSTTIDVPRAYSFVLGRSKPN